MTPVKRPSLMGCDAVSWGEWFPTFRKVTVPTTLKINDHKYERNTILLNVRN